MGFITFHILLSFFKIFKEETMLPLVIEVTFSAIHCYVVDHLRIQWLVIVAVLLSLTFP